MIEPNPNPDPDPDAEGEGEGEVSEHRHRLLEGMARAVSERGYNDTTIADIVRHAAVSRRTFYEHFSTKAECLTDLYEAASHNAFKVLREAINPALPWESRVETALRAYFGFMAQSPVLLRTLFIEILALGPQGLDARRRRNREIADFIMSAVNGPGRAKRVTPIMAMAVVGAINELVLDYIERGKVDRLPDLVGPASALVRAIIGTD